jgi:uncharacterized protein YecE (DUF72 family)
LQIGIAVEPADVVEQAQHFRLIEVDAGLDLLTARTVEPWLDRTPEGTVIDVRAHRLLTQHTVPLETVWLEVRDVLSPTLRSLGRAHVGELPARALDLALDRFVASVKPLQDAHKLGVVVFPFPSYFVPSTRATEYLTWLRSRCRDLPLAVELRHRRWLDSTHRAETLRFLTEQRLSFVCVDAPPGFDSTIPPLAVATVGPAVVRFHGRDADAWQRDSDSGDDRFGSGYRRADLEAWRPRIDKLTTGRAPVHVVFTTSPPDVAARDARLLIRVLTEADSPGSNGPPRS